MVHDVGKAWTYQKLYWVAQQLHNGGTISLRVREDGFELQETNPHRRRWQIIMVRSCSMIVFFFFGESHDSLVEGLRIDCPKKKRVETDRSFAGM